MSDYESASGYVFKLKTPIPEDQYGVRADALYDATDGKLRINYEGTLLFATIEQVKAGEGVDFLHIAHNRDLVAAVDQAADVGLAVELESARWFSTCWYNGTDSYMDELTLADFIERTAP